MLEIDIITVQPEMFCGFLSQSVLGRAVDRKLCNIEIIDLKQYGIGRWHKTDDTIYGGGPGQLMRCEPWYAAVEALFGGPERPSGTEVIMTSPTGRRFCQREAESLAHSQRLIFMCGHYEGFDARIERLATKSYSLGDFILTGGELAAAVMTDATVRLLPGAIGGGAAAIADESFGAAGLLEPPQYTHPADFRGMKVPEVLLSGNHARIEAWRMAEARRITAERRPDLLNGAAK